MMNKGNTLPKSAATDVYNMLPTVPSIVYNDDCMHGLKRFPDKCFDLAIVDPPYGIGKDRLGAKSSKNANSMGNFYHDLQKNWDEEKPKQEYFFELMRVSKNQIIWGGNYFGLPAHRTFVVWDKMTYIPSMSRVELAWTSFDKPARYVRINSNDLNRIHPTQKPIALYEWLLNEYASDGDLILDTHVGSGSSRIACDKGGFNFVGFEIDKDYFNEQEKRFKLFKQQMRLF